MPALAGVGLVLVLTYGIQASRTPFGYLEAIGSEWRPLDFGKLRSQGCEERFRFPRVPYPGIILREFEVHGITHHTYFPNGLLTLTCIHTTP